MYKARIVEQVSFCNKMTLCYRMKGTAAALIAKFGCYGAKKKFKNSKNK